MEFSIEIPSDDDGYVFFLCPKCSEFFKITPDDYYDDEVLEIHCPACGLTSENFLTDDVIELALEKTQNYMNDLIFEALAK